MYFIIVAAIKQRTKLAKLKDIRTSTLYRLNGMLIHSTKNYRISPCISKLQLVLVI